MKNKATPTLHDNDQPNAALAGGNSGARQIFKLGLDVDLNNAVTAIQCGAGEIKRGQSFSRARLLGWVRTQVNAGHTVHTIYEACGFGYTLRTLAAAVVLGHSDAQTNAPMKKIIRISRAHFDPQKVNEVIPLLLESRDVIWPKQEQLPGYVDGDLGIDRQNGSMLWITFWDTLEHAKALGSLPEMVESNARFKAGGLKFDPIITHEIL
jgi:hypothetical protein